MGNIVNEDGLKGNATNVLDFQDSYDLAGADTAGYKPSVIRASLKIGNRRPRAVNLPVHGHATPNQAAKQLMALLNPYTLAKWSALTTQIAVNKDPDVPADYIGKGLYKNLGFKVVASDGRQDYVNINIPHFFLPVPDPSDPAGTAAMARLAAEIIASNLIRVFGNDDYVEFVG